MNRCVVCDKEDINNHSYLIEDDPTFYTHCFGCSFDLLIEQEKECYCERHEYKSFTGRGKGDGSHRGHR